MDLPDIINTLQAQVNKLMLVHMNELDQSIEAICKISQAQKLLEEANELMVTKEAIEIIEQFGHSIALLHWGNYRVKWASGVLQEISGTELINLANGILIAEGEG
jgi:hypothetical protein